MKTCEGVEIQLHALLTSTLGKGNWSGLCPEQFGHRKQSPLSIGKLSRPKNWPGYSGEEKNLCPCWKSQLCSSVCQRVSWP